MNNRSNKLISLNSRFIELFFSTLLVGLPILTVVEANAHPHPESTQKETESNAIEPENSGVYNDIDGGYDGKPVMTIVPTEGTVDVKLKNNTNALIDYQAIGYTENQTLKGGQEHTMRNLPLPVVIRSARQDDGFIKVLPLKDTSEEGILEVTLDEDPDFYDDKNLGVIRIEEDGGVFLN